MAQQTNYNSQTPKSGSQQQTSSKPQKNFSGQSGMDDTRKASGLKSEVGNVSQKNSSSTDLEEEDEGQAPVQ